MEVSRDSLRIKLFADGADLAGMIEMASKAHIAGLTTNPTLMRKSGITDYAKFAKEVIREIPNKPISFEVFSDDLKEMELQALKIASWGENVFVKIPITNAKGHPTSVVVSNLSKRGIKINVTALTTIEQVREISIFLNPEIPSYVSVFAGRIADTGRNPIPTIKQSLECLSDNKACELIWASPRELLNVIEADSIGCHVITATSDILAKLHLIGKDLVDYSLETVKMFRNDALESGLSIQE